MSRSRGISSSRTAFGMAVEGVKGAEDIDRGVGIADHEHGGTGFVRGRRGERRVRRGGGERGSNQDSDHPTASFTAASWSVRTLSGLASLPRQFPARGELVRTPLKRIVPPSPIPDHYGHRGVNKSLAETEKMLIFLDT